MHVRLFAEPIHLGKKTDPLLSGYKPNYGTFKERQPLLLDELRACITLLEAAKKKTPYKQPQLQRDYRKYAVLFMSLAFLGLSGTGGMLTVMLMMMRFAHENILPELQKQIQLLYEYTTGIDSEIDRNNQVIDAHYKSYATLSEAERHENNLYDKWWDGLNYNNVYYDRETNIPDSVNNCVEWNDPAGRQKLIDIFPDINESSGPCWFSKNNKTHPLEYCNEIANNTCITSDEIIKLKSQHQILHDEMNNAETARQKLQQEKGNIENEIHTLESRVNNPYSEPEPITTTIFAAVALLSIAGIIYAAYRLYHSRQVHHADIESHGNTIKRFLSSIDQTDQARVTKLALRLGDSIQDDTTIDSLLNSFKQKAGELEQQRKQRMGFFAGVKIENFAAGNHQFLTNEASRNITQTIFEHAGLMSKK